MGTNKSSGWCREDRWFQQHWCELFAICRTSAGPRQRPCLL